MILKIPCRVRDGYLLEMIEPCPFCGQKHIHGLGNGSRVPHCKNPPKQEYYIFEQKVPSEIREEVVE